MGGWSESGYAAPWNLLTSACVFRLVFVKIRPEVRHKLFLLELHCSFLYNLIIVAKENHDAW